MNRIIIKPIEEGFEPQSYLLNEDFNVEAKSEFSSFGELLPGGVNDIINVLTASQSMGGKTSEGMQYIHSVIDMKRWTRTNPITINVTLKFFTKENVIRDVWYPTNLFLSLAILSRTTSTSKDSKGNPIPSHVFATPGPNLGILKNISEAIKGESEAIIEGTSNIKNIPSKTNEIESASNIFPSKIKIISCLIPGIVYLPLAFVESVAPTFSNKTVFTEDGNEYPLWSALQLQITGLTPATDEMLVDANKIQVIDSDGSLSVSLKRNANLASQQTAQIQSVAMKESALNSNVSQQ